jgi:hypothetical protein
MSRNNQDRLGAPAFSGAEDAPPPAVEQPQSTLQFSVPTELVELPSRGEFYPADHPLHNKTTVEIKHMTAKDEDILTNKTFIKNGVVLDRLLENVILDKSIDLDSLLVGDKSAILIASRISGYGQNYAAQIPCPSCGEVDDFEFDLNEAQSFNDPSDSHYDVEKSPTGTFLIKLPRTGACVEVKMLTGRDEKKLINTNKMRQKNKLPELGLTDQTKLFIVSIDGETDKGKISAFVDNMPALDSKNLRDAYRSVTPNVELAQQWTCPSCTYEQVLEVPFSTEFFWPK